MQLIRKFRVGQLKIVVLYPQNSIQVQLLTFSVSTDVSCCLLLWVSSLTVMWKMVVAATPTPTPTSMMFLYIRLIYKVRNRVSGISFRSVLYPVFSKSLYRK
jgi:hypothetical protein